MTFIVQATVRKQHRHNSLWGIYMYTLIAVYAHFNRFINLTINSHTNRYNLASSRLMWVWVTCGLFTALLWPSCSMKLVLGLIWRPVQVQVRIKMTEFGFVFEQQDLNVANSVAVTHLKDGEPLVKLANNNHLPLLQLPKTYCSSRLIKRKKQKLRYIKSL